jgi:hypothetical protein
VPLFDLDNLIYLYLKNNEPLTILPESAGPLVEHLKHLSAMDGHPHHLLDPDCPAEMVESELNDVNPQ